jgi:hypothetical protein
MLASKAHVREQPKGGRMCRDEALKYLQWNWDEAYEITEASGVWRAVRLDNQKTLIATEAQDLRDEIVQDYAANPVPRDRR